jgi:hypothetical protein
MAAFRRRAGRLKDRRALWRKTESQPALISRRAIHVLFFACPFVKIMAFSFHSNSEEADNFN